MDLLPHSQKLMSRRGGRATLFVGNLSYDTRERDLEDIFLYYGRINRFPLTNHHLTHLLAELQNRSEIPLCFR